MSQGGIGCQAELRIGGSLVEAGGAARASSGVVFDLRKFSVRDGPGIRTAVFLKGCPLDCPWCHNPEGRDPGPAILRRPDRCVACLSCLRACPMGIDPRLVAGTSACDACPDFGACAHACPSESLQTVGEMRDLAWVMDAIRKDRPFYDESGGGVTFTGGEPLSRPGFLGELLDACRAEGIHTAIETSGFASRAVMLDIARRCDLLLYDLKTADAARGGEFCGIDYSICLDNLAAVARARLEDHNYADIRVRIPLIPGANDSPGSLGAMADFVAALAVQPSVDLLPYHGSAEGKYRLWNLTYRMAGTAEPDPAALEAARAVFSSRGIAAGKEG
ncbi:MAG: glycyl-radical enzyme activating protein [Rectinemataceae bacterium]